MQMYGQLCGLLFFYEGKKLKVKCVCASSPGHAEEHTSGPRRPPAPADGPGRTGDVGREAQRKEEGSRPALRDPTHCKGHERTLPQQGVCVCVCPEVHVCDHHTVRRSAFLTHEVILCAFFFFFLFAWDWLELMIYSLHTLMSFKLFSTCCGISLCPSVGGYPALELHIFFNSSLAWIAYS